MNGSAHGSLNGAATAAAANGHADRTGADVAVEVAGADFDWADRSWAEPAAGAASAPPEAAPEAAAAAGGSAFQLRHLQFRVERGQLVAIVGAVGSGEEASKCSGGGRKWW